jgi:hypothetical protein
MILARPLRPAAEKTVAPFRRRRDRQEDARHWLVRQHRSKDDQVLLEEYRAMRDEITTAMNSQISVLAFGAATLGFSFAAASTTSDKHFREMFLLVLVPLLCYLILTVWFAEVLRMLRAGTFLMRLEKRLDELGFGALSWESSVFQARCETGPTAFLQDPDRFRTYAIMLLFWTIAGTSIAIGWHAVSAYSWQHFFAIAALAVSIAVLAWLQALRLRQVKKLAIPPLRIGASGDDVRWVQEILQSEGIYAGNVDGQFGSLTAEAVCCFQWAHDLEADGIVGFMTMILLDERQARSQE